MHNTRKCFHICLDVTVKLTEQWLSHMALDGWRLVSIHGWQFTFMESRPTNREYFIYNGLDSSKGISHDYYEARKKYRSADSPLISDVVFEVNPKLRDAQFLEYVEQSDRYYIKHFTSTTAIMTIIVSGFLILGFVTSFWYLFAVSLIPLFYSLISLAILLSKPSRNL